MTPAELRALRKSKQLTARQAGALLGMTDMGYTAYETGRRVTVPHHVIDAITSYEPPPIEGDDNRARLKRFLRQHQINLAEFAATAGITRMDAVKIHSHDDYRPGPRVHARCLAVGLDLHRSEKRPGWRPETNLIIPAPADTDQARAIVAYMHEHQVSMAEVARRCGSTPATVKDVVVNGGRPRRSDIRAAFAAVGVVWPEADRAPVRVRPERKPKPKPEPRPKPSPRSTPKRPPPEPKPRPKPPVRWSPCGDSEQSRLLDEWMRKHHSPAHAAQTIRIDQATLLRIRRGSKPRCYRVRDKLAAIGVVWPVEAQPAEPVASKKIGHCACGAVLTRNRTVVLDGVAMCPACHRRFFGVGR